MTALESTSKLRVQLTVRAVSRRDDGGESDASAHGGTTWRAEPSTPSFCLSMAYRGVSLYAAAV